MIEPEIKESCQVNTKQQPCLYAPSVKATLLTDLNHPYLHITANVNEKVLVDQNLNLCALTKQSGMDMYGQLVLDLLKNKLNFMLECPFKKVISINILIKIWYLLFVH